MLNTKKTCRYIFCLHTRGNWSFICLMNMYFENLLQGIFIPQIWRLTFFYPFHLWDWKPYSEFLFYYDKVVTQNSGSSTGDEIYPEGKRFYGSGFATVTTEGSVWLKSFQSHSFLLVLNLFLILADRSIIGIKCAVFLQTIALSRTT